MTEPKPLEGIRVLALTQAWAGPFATELLAFLGAEVIQLESRSRPDNFRGSYQGSIPEALQLTPTAKHPWNVASSYNATNLNKLGITLDLSTPEGKDIFLRLVDVSDVVAENFSPRVMGNFGLDYENLVERKPDLIMISMSAYGATGPYANYPGIGGTIEAMSGMTSLLGYPGESGMNSGIMYPDPVAGYMGAVALTMAIYHREVTGEGQWIDLSMQEANMAFIGDALLEYARNGTVRGPMGNRSPSIAPHGIFPTADGRWIAIAACDDEAFLELSERAGAEWSRQERFATNSSRMAHVEELETAIERWSGGYTLAELEEQLTGSNIAYAPVLDAGEVLELPGLAERGAIATLEHPEAGTHRYITAPWRIDDQSLSPFTPAPLHGQHSFEVFERLLGMNRDEYETLVRAGVTGEGPPEEQ